MRDEQGTAGQATIKIVLADDHVVVRRALGMLLEADSELEVVAQAGDVETAIRYVRGHKPDVLLLDLGMPQGSSLPAIPQIKEISPDTGIVVLTMEADPAFARRALQAGATGYILKEAAETELVEAVRKAAAGETYVQPALGAKLAAAPSGPPDDLSRREVEVLRLIALGHTNTEIAQELHLSVRTVETHRSHLQQKLGLGKRSELVHYARERNLIEP